MRDEATIPKIPVTDSQIIATHATYVGFFFFFLILKGETASKAVNSFCPKRGCFLMC